MEPRLIAQEAHDQAQAAYRQRRGQIEHYFDRTAMNLLQPMMSSSAFRGLIVHGG